MQIPGKKSDTPNRPRTTVRRRRGPSRKVLRALHRDAGYLAVGLTFVYALSGLSVNHIADWDPNFTNVERSWAWPQGLELDQEVQDPKGAARALLEALGKSEEPRDVYAVDRSHVDITLEHSTVYVDFAARTVREEGQKPRLLLRLANWLHLNRGKKAWTYVADSYAVFLLFLAISGLFMLPGRKGIVGRGGVLALVGAAVPVLYVVLSGGP